MSEAPFWLENEGKFDRPSSSVPKREERSDAVFANPRDKLDTRPIRQPRSYIEQRLADAARSGVIAVGTSTVTARIDAAIAKLKADGYGDPGSIYLIDCDMMALREATGVLPETYRDAIVRAASEGTGSKVYSRRGIARAVRRPKRGDA